MAEPRAVASARKAGLVPKVDPQKTATRRRELAGKVIAISEYRASVNTVSQGTRVLSSDPASQQVGRGVVWLVTPPPNGVFGLSALF